MFVKVRVSVYLACVENRQADFREYQPILEKVTARPNKGILRASSSLKGFNSHSS